MRRRKRTERAEASPEESNPVITLRQSDLTAMLARLVALEVSLEVQRAIMDALAETERR